MSLGGGFVFPLSIESQVNVIGSRILTFYVCHKTPHIHKTSSKIVYILPLNDLKHIL